MEKDRLRAVYMAVGVNGGSFLHLGGSERTFLFLAIFTYQEHALFSFLGIHLKYKLDLLTGPPLPAPLHGL